MTRHELTEHVLIIQAYSKLLLVAKTRIDFNYAKYKIREHSEILYLTHLQEDSECEIALAVREEQPSDNPMPRTE